MKTLIFVASLFYVYSAAGQVNSAKEVIKDNAYQKAILFAERFVDSLRMKQDIPGISICVGTANKLLWAEGFGYADVEGHRLVTIRSRFRLGSVSKSVTSVALGKLIEEGKLDLDAPVQQYVPYFPDKRFSFSSRQLATHTAGIRHYQDTDPVNCPRRYASVQEGLAIFKADSLLSKPGTAYSYSTYGYTVLSAIIEAASHTDYLSYMQRTVFSPLGMTHTGADYSDSIVTDRVRFYEHHKDKLVNAAQVDNSYKWAGGGLLSTPIDLVKLGTALLGSRLLRQETVALLFTPQLLANGTNTHYGLGWRIGTDQQGRAIIHHGGSIDGGRAFLLIYPEHDLVVAITANMSGVSINWPELETIANYFFQVKR